MNINEFKMRSQIRLALIKMEEKLGRRLLMSEFFKLNNISQNRLYACYASGKM